MNNRLVMQDLAELLAERTGKDKKDTELFLREFITVVSEGVYTDKIVKVKGLGTFKIILVEKRESVHVNTGERFIIPEHYKFSFVPDKDLKEMVNKPFSFFETTELNESVDFDIDESEDDKDPDDESVEEVMPDQEIPIHDEEPDPIQKAAVEKLIEEPVKETIFESVEEPVVDEPVKETVLEEPIHEEIAEEPEPIQKTAVEELIEEPVKETILESVEESVVDEPVKEIVLEEPIHKEIVEEPEPIQKTAVEELIEEPVKGTILESVEEPVVDEPVKETVLEEPMHEEIVEEPIEETKPPIIQRESVYDQEYKMNTSEGSSIKKIIVFVLALAFISIVGFYIYQGFDGLSSFKQVEGVSRLDIVSDEGLSTISDSLYTDDTLVDTAEMSMADPLIVDSLVVSEPKTTPALVSPATTTKPVISTPVSTSGKDLAKIKIKSGDRLTLIALEYYGSKVFWVYLYDYNKSVMKDPNNVSVGTVVSVPAPEVYGIDVHDKASVAKAAARQTEILAGKL